jgi:hypothetical protein
MITNINDNKNILNINDNISKNSLVLFENRLEDQVTDDENNTGNSTDDSHDNIKILTFVK